MASLYSFSADLKSFCSYLALPLCFFSSAVCLTRSACSSIKFAPLLLLLLLLGPLVGCAAACPPNRPIPPECARDGAEEPGAALVLGAGCAVCGCAAEGCAAEGTWEPAVPRAPLRGVTLTRKRLLAAPLVPLDHAKDSASGDVTFAPVVALLLVAPALNADDFCGAS